jgi:hypothetical protein
MTAVLPTPAAHLRTVAESPYLPVPRFQHACPTCRKPVAGLLAECDNPACVTAANDFDLNSGGENPDD